MPDFDPESFFSSSFLLFDEGLYEGGTYRGTPGFLGLDIFVDEELLSFLREEMALLLDAEDYGIPRRSLAVNLFGGTYPREFYLGSSSSLF